MFKPLVPFIVGILTVVVPIICLDTEHLPVWLDTTLSIWMFILFLWMISAILVSLVKAAVEAWGNRKAVQRNKNNRRRKRGSSDSIYDGGSSYFDGSDNGGDSHCGGDSGGDCGGGGD
jgi:uncharacterized membrane protein YgcG